MSTGPTMKRGKSQQDQGTPWHFIRVVEARFGPITWDLAAHHGNAKHKNYFDLADNSFAQDWHKIPGNLWLNPEFDDIGPWAQKCAYEGALGAQILFLTPASIGSNWFAQYCHRKSLVLGLNGRITFIGSKDPYPKDLMLSCFGFGVGFDTWRWPDEIANLI